MPRSTSLSVATMGLVPRQISTGDRTILGKVSKRFARMSGRTQFFGNRLSVPLLTA